MALRPFDLERIKNGDDASIRDTLVAMAAALNDLIATVGGLTPRWVDVDFDAADFTGAGGTWTLSSGDVREFVWCRLGHLFIVQFWFITTSTGAGLTNPLYVRIPRGLKAGGSAQQTGVIYLSDNGGATEVGLVTVNGVGGDANKLQLWRLSGNWTAAVTNDTHIQGFIVFQIAPPGGS